MVSACRLGGAPIAYGEGPLERAVEAPAEDGLETSSERGCASYSTAVRGEEGRLLTWERCVDGERHWALALERSDIPHVAIRGDRAALVLINDSALQRLDLARGVVTDAIGGFTGRARIDQLALLEGGGEVVVVDSDRALMFVSREGERGPALALAPARPTNYRRSIALATAGSTALLLTDTWDEPNADEVTPELAAVTREGVAWRLSLPTAASLRSSLRVAPDGALWVASATPEHGMIVTRVDSSGARRSRAVERAGSVVIDASGAALIGWYDAGAVQLRRLEPRRLQVEALPSQPGDGQLVADAGGRFVQIVQRHSGMVTRTSVATREALCAIDRRRGVSTQYTRLLIHQSGQGIMVDGASVYRVC